MKTSVAPISEEVVLEDLLESAYPEHNPSYLELRQAAYEKKARGEYSFEVSNHVEMCKLCQVRLERIWKTDPLLTGKWDENVRVLVNATTDPVAAARIESWATYSIERVMQRGVGLIAAVRTFFAVASNHTHPAEPDIENLRREFSAMAKHHDVQSADQDKKPGVALTS